MKEKSGSAQLVFYNLQTGNERADFSREYRFVRVFLLALGAPRAYRRVSRPERPYEIQEYGGAVVSVSRSSTMSPQPVDAHSPFAAALSPPLLLSAYRDFSQADPSCAFSARARARGAGRGLARSYHVAERSTGSCIGGTRLTMRED